MTSTVPGFDDWLNDVLAKEAAIAGESVDDFIARAVTARLAVEQARRGAPDLDETLRRVREMDMEVPLPQSNVHGGSVIADPDRLLALYETGLLDSDRGAALDRIVEMAIAALGVPSALVSLVDHNRVYLPSAIGLPEAVALARQVPLERSISRPIVSTGEAVITSDARNHRALKNHPMVLRHHVVAFAGFPLTDPNGHTIGTLAVWDPRPREWTAGHMRILEDLAAMLCDQIFGNAEVAG